MNGKMNGKKEEEDELEGGGGEEEKEENEKKETRETERIRESKENRRTEGALAAMHAGLDGSRRRNDKVKARSTTFLRHFQRRATAPKVRRITVHEMNGNVKGSKKKSNAKERKVSALNPLLYAGTGALLGSVASLTASEKTERIMMKGESSDVIKDHDFKFENLVFEGGGNKGMAYVGTLQVLEEAGIMRNIKRVAGASAGAIIACLIALGFDSVELKEFLEQDLRPILVDHTCGYCSLLPNLLKGFGWNPGKKLLRWFGDQLKERTGDCDITFKEVLERYGKELCIVVTNLSQMSVEYFHPKTTPNTPVRRAVRMSVALPGVFQCVREMNNDCEDVYVDGGLLCNYPIHAFDGWWLSMDPKDTFFKKLQPLEDFARLFEKSERFGSWNKKTLGIVLFSHTETELMKTLLSEREGNRPPEPPSTKLAKQRLKLQDQQLLMKQEHIEVVHAVGRFIKELQRNNLDEDSIINMKELKGVFTNPKDFSVQDAEMLFGADANYKRAFEELDTDEDGEITFQELMAFIEKKGVNLQTRFLGYSRKEIRHLGDFIQTLQTALSVNVKRVYVEKRDVERTIGIDTDYIESNDFFLETEDKRFLVESGKRATRAFLHEHIRRLKGDDLNARQSHVKTPVTVSVKSASPHSNSSLTQVDSASNFVHDYAERSSVNNTPPSSAVSIVSSESSGGSQVVDVRRKSGSLRLPPLPGIVSTPKPSLKEREDSGESVASTGKVNVLVAKSPSALRSSKVGVVHTVV